MGRTVLRVQSNHRVKRHGNAKPIESRRARRAAALKRYGLSPRGRYQQHKTNAKRRGVPFLLSYDQWWGIWQRSGRWDERGNTTADGYVMARHGDIGAYEADNVSIIKHCENVGERNYWFAKRRSDDDAPVPGARDTENYPYVPF